MPRSSITSLRTQALRARSWPTWNLQAWKTASWKCCQGPARSPSGGRPSPSPAAHCRTPRKTQCDSRSGQKVNRTVIYTRISNALQHVQDPGHLPRPRSQKPLKLPNTSPHDVKRMINPLPPLRLKIAPLRSKRMRDDRTARTVEALREDSLESVRGELSSPTQTSKQELGADDTKLEPKSCWKRSSR